MTGADELRKRREQEALRIRTALNRQRGEQRASTKGGEGTVAFVEERKCLDWESGYIFIIMGR